MLDGDGAGGAAREKPPMLSCYVSLFNTGPGTELSLTLASTVARARLPTRHTTVQCP